MNREIRRGSTRRPPPASERVGQTADLGPHPISSAVVSVWREERRSVPQAQVRAMKALSRPFDFTEQTH